MNSFGQLPNAYFKFVISEREDLEEVRTLAQRYGVPKERVLLMPEGTTVKKVQERGRWLVQACVDEGYRFTTRLHILLWGRQARSLNQDVPPAVSTVALPYRPCRPSGRSGRYGPSLSS